MSESMSDRAELDPTSSSRTLSSDSDLSSSNAESRNSAPKIGDSRPGVPSGGANPAPSGESGDPSRPRRRRRGGRGRGGQGQSTQDQSNQGQSTQGRANTGQATRPQRQPGPKSAARNGASEELAVISEIETARIDSEIDEPTTGESVSRRAGARPGVRRRRGRERNGRPVGRYLMCVQVKSDVTQIAVLEGRSLIEHHVARASDGENQIDGNIYFGRVKNVLPGMEAAFVDIGTPKNAVLYWGDLAAHGEETEEGTENVRRIEHLLRPGQTIICQVTKNPIGLKGARLTEEVSLPGRFVVLVPNSDVSGISKRLDDHERRRLRRLLDDVRPEGHGIIVRTAAEGVSEDDLRRDVDQLLVRWKEIEAQAKRSSAPTLLYSEPLLALRAIREELTEEYRGVIIDDADLYALVRSYVADIDPALADRVEYYDLSTEALPIFERHHVHEQLHKALDRKVWLASGGSLIIERTEALTVIDVNTGKNVGSSNLEETVFRNNLEAAEEIARQLRLRDIGGIIVIDFIDMEIKSNRQEVLGTLRAALSRDKTPTQCFDISELGLVEMTRKRIGVGLVESLSDTCPMCDGRGLVFSQDFA